ncbi:MAG: Gfo/Idh/MocA family oxidoreductase [Proteobacteria bacterium]|nr:Gfo/Idh/MocA family oxidoreductase [Pseudomonadota bacterium]
MKPLRVGLIGSGGISRTYMAAMEHVPEGRVVGVWSRRRERAEAFAAEFELAHATDRVEDLLAEVDVACVNSPNACHAEHAIAAAAAGVHVVVEKPFAVNLEEAATIIDACKRAGVGLAYAEELTFVPRFHEARRILRSGAIGVPLYVTQREAHAGPYSPWFFTRDEAGGGVLMDMACHSIECVRWLLGKPDVVGVTGHLGTGRHPGPLDDHAVLHLRFDGGTVALCEASWVLQGGMQSKLEIWGSEGTLEVDLLGETGLRLYARAAAAEPSASGHWSTPLASWVAENGYPQELSHFLGCFARGEAPEESGEDGEKVLEILYAAYASAREGREIALPFRPAGVDRAVDLWLGPPVPATRS